MDNNLEEPIYQYYEIENDNLININDETLQLPDETSNDTNQIYFLTLTGQENEDNEIITTNDNNNSSLLQADHLINSTINDDINIQTINNDSNTNIKLITLEDGRMFMTTNSGEEYLDLIEPHLITSNNQDDVVVEEEEEEEDEEELINTVSFTNEESVDNCENNFQLVELEDGTQTIVQLQLYQLNENNNTNAIEETTIETTKKEKKFHCEHEGCDKAYATSYHLGVHMRNHMDCKPFACEIDGCNKKFTTSYSLKAHSRTHTGEKPYSCTTCPKQFKTSGDLLKHNRVHTGEKPFQCPFEGCGKRFTTSNIRKVHVRSHTGERPFSCEFPNCGKSFTSSTNYKNHIRIHSGEKPYVCQVEGCDKKFTEYSSLYKHNTVHQIVRPFVCTYCGQRFKQEYAMNVHKRLKHYVVVNKSGTEILVNVE